MKECSHRIIIGSELMCTLAPGVHFLGMQSESCPCHKCVKEWDVEPAEQTIALRVAINPLATIKSGPVGLGDTIANITHATGLDRLAEAYTAITGKPCGCKERQEALNKLVPYKLQSHAATDAVPDRTPEHKDG